MATTLNKDDIARAYNDVREDKTDTNWAVFKYNGKELCHDSSGSDYSEFKNKFTEDERGFGYVRCTTGDELSKRCKFAFITWCGSNVGAFKRAKLSTDKSLVKGIITSYAAEIQPNDADELEEQSVKDVLIKAGGANYGTGGVDLSSESNGTGREQIPVEPTPAQEPEPEPEPVYEEEPITDDNIVEDSPPAEQGYGGYAEEGYNGSEDNGVNPETEYGAEEMEEDEQ